MNSRDEANHDPFERIYSTQTEKVSPLKKYGGKIAGGIACSIFVYFIMHIGVVVAVLRWTCEIGGRVLGRPGTAVKLDKLEDKAGDLLRKVELHDDAQANHPPVAIKNIPFVKKAEAVRDTAKQVAEVKETATHGVEVVKETGGKVVDTLKDMGSRTKEAVGGMGAGISEMMHARAKAQEEALKAQQEAYRERLIVRAKAINFPIDESWSLTRLDAEVQQAERQWKVAHGPNASCPNQKCRYGLRIKSKHLGEMIRCPKCNAVFSRRQAVALGPPPPPQPMRRGVLGR